MEHLFSYRHIVEKGTKDIFIKCFKEALREMHPKHIGFVGFIGSYKKEFSHDIDVLIFPNEKSKIGETIIEVIKLYDKTENIIKARNRRLYLSLSPHKTMQEMMHYLSAMEEGGAGLIPIHSLFFPDYKSFKRFNPKNFLETIKHSLKTIYGNFDVIKSSMSEKVPQEKLEPYFVILDFEMSTKKKTFPRHLVRASSESLFSYLKEKYSIPIKKCNFHDISDIDKELTDILKYLDKINYKKT